ncbi:SDR family oxidoreductase [Mesorhizobium sp. YC-39]|uniref:SDR family NAD(P)-dependent oxidoreductase n=1 Tax=unclassified Mesorhizobium TaxID=325217 RepID=UPI0021E7ED06|nr:MULTISPECIES: SDR family NAD(P)-dependent oxidoreductase [unclassified Mesorhizobium]MCV3205145.1 SDR family oxidoreductase [Mesorhizobium sp. YC-2]MCV3228456.1 SDR family oxidoreductase [Mesorhizobium sp. YC-39]
MKTAIVTGAAGGIGAAIATQFASTGATVVALDRSFTGMSEQASEAGHILSASFDVSNEGDWDRISRMVSERFGHIDALVNNAAIFNPVPFLDESVAGFQAVTEVNQLGTFLGMRAAVPLMPANGGAIVNVCSTGGLRGFSGAFAYSTSKWAIRGMTKVAARELAGRKIRVNAVHPGLVDTPMLGENTAENLAEMAAAVPLNRLARPEEIARLVMFLASPGSEYITGSEFTIDGGQTI